MTSFNIINCNLGFDDIFCLPGCHPLHILTDPQLHNLSNNQEEDSLAPQERRKKRSVCRHHPHHHCHGLCQLSQHQDCYKPGRTSSCLSR